VATIHKPQPIMPIYVTEHARRRARERCPGFKSARIIDEVRAAMREGRISADPPSGVAYDRRYANVLFVWSEQRCYPIKPMPGGDNGFMVCTTVARKAEGALSRPTV